MTEGLALLGAWGVFAMLVGVLVVAVLSRP